MASLVQRMETLIDQCQTCGRMVTLTGSEFEALGGFYCSAQCERDSFIGGKVVRFMAEDEEGGTIDYTRANFRMPEAMGRMVMEAGSRVGYDSMGPSARHCMVIGLQVIMQQQGVSRSADATAAMAAAMEKALALEARGLASSTKLDTIGNKSADLEHTKRR